MATVLDPTDYVIRTRFEVNDDVPGLHRVTNRLQDIDRSVRGIAQSVSSRLGMAFAGLATGAGIVALTRGIIGINSELQNAEYGIATLFSALGKQDMTTALAGARAQVRGLREDAAKGVGELADYVQGFQMMLSPGLTSGATTEQIRELNRLVLAGGFALRGQEGLRLGPMDVVQSMNESAGVETYIVNQALRTIGVSNKQFNAMDQQRRFQTLMQAFQSFQEPAKAMANTWDAQISTFSDTVKDLARDASKPLFTAWLTQLQQVNEWLSLNRDGLSDMAEDAGQRLLDIYGQLVTHARSLVSLTAAAAGAATAIPAVSAVGRTVTAGAAAAGLGASGATGGLIAASAVGPAAIVGALTGAVTGAIARFPELGAKLGVSVDLFLSEAGRLVTLFGALFQGPVFTSIGYYLGLFVDKMIDLGTVFVRGLSMLVEAMSGIQQSVYAAFKAGESYLSGDRASGLMWETIARQTATVTTGVLAQRLDSLFDPSKRKSRADAPGEPGGPPVTNNNFNLNGPINVTVKAERLDDPNTVARSFEDVLRAMAEYPLQARGGRLLPKPL